MPVLLIKQIIRDTERTEQHGGAQSEAFPGTSDWQQVVFCRAYRGRQTSLKTQLIKIASDVHLEHRLGVETLI